MTTPITEPPVEPADDGAGTAVLQASAIAKAYRRGVWPRRRTTQGLSGADLTLYPGEVVGLVGENRPDKAKDTWST